MCIIMFQKEGTKRFPSEWVETAARTNSDGCGIMWSHGGKLHIYRSLKNIDGIWRRYCSARDLGAPVGLHFRIRTHGDVSESNCHPFILSTENSERTMALMHNGIVGDLGKLPAGWSDTRYFADAVISKLPVGFLSNDAMREVIQRGVHGKYLFMDSAGWWIILRSEQGNWNEDRSAWFSNSSYRPWTKGSYETYGHRRSGDMFNNKTGKWEPKYDKEITKYDKDAEKEYRAWWEKRMAGGGHNESCICKNCDSMRAVEAAQQRRFREEIESAAKDRTKSHLAGPARYRPKFDCGWCGGLHDRHDEVHKKEVLHALYRRSATFTEKWSEVELDNGVLYQGQVCCWDCIDANAKDEDMWEITLPVVIPIVCATCDELLYDPSEDAGVKELIQL